MKSFHWLAAMLLHLVLAIAVLGATHNYTAAVLTFIVLYHLYEIGSMVKEIHDVFIRTEED